jgi:hypothetical protein
MWFGKLSVEDNYDECRTDWCCRHRRTAALAVPGLALAAIEHPGYRGHFYPKSIVKNLVAGNQWRLLSRRQLTEREMADPSPQRSEALPPRLRRLVEGLGPYQSLALVLIPTGLVEPLKLIAVAVVGDGHWITGTVMIVAAYAAGPLLVDRLFVVVKPKLLTLPWFARLWRWFVAVRSKAVGLFRRSS